MLNREVQLHVPRKESYPVPLSHIDVTRSTCADLKVAQEQQIYDYWDVDKNRNLSESWTGFQKICVVERNSSKGERQSRGGERNKNKWIEKLLFHAKERTPEHANGKPLLKKKNKSRSFWSKIHLYWYCRRQAEFCVVLHLGTRIRSNEKVWKKALHLIILFLRWKFSACCLVWGYGVSVGQNYSSNPKTWGVRDISSENLGRKKYKLQMLFCSANLGCTHQCGECTHKQNMDIGKPRVTNGSDNSGDLSLRDACLGKPKSMNKRSFTPSNVDSRCKGDNGKGMKEGHKEGIFSKKKESPFVALMDIH